MKFLKKYHKWLAVVFTLFIILFSISGILLNHRELFSHLDINRNYLPSDYQAKNWNNAAVKSTLKINRDTVFIYGNLGIWKTNSKFDHFQNFSTGLPSGIDNQKIFSMIYTSKRELYAGTLFGLYQFNTQEQKWTLIPMPTHEKLVVDLIEKDGQLLVLLRSNLLIKTTNRDFKIIELPQPENYDHKIGLFKTLWVIHSGEIYGTIGKLLVDLVGLIFIFLSVTGLIIFINKYRIKNKRRKEKPAAKLRSINLWNLIWHNKIGWTTVILLIITTATGMFLRPPLLVAIAYAKVGKIPGTELASPNPWFDKLRRIAYDDENHRYLVATLDGIYYSDDEFQSNLKMFYYQPPVSVMGVNVFEKVATNTYLIGSFEGLFVWNPASGLIWDYIKKEEYLRPTKIGPPIGDFLVTAYSDDFDGQEIVFDFDLGAININRGKTFPMQSNEITEAYRMSLWNLALEIHTARFYKIFFGPFYILIIPISGFVILFILVSGFLVWWKWHRKKNYKVH